MGLISSRDMSPTQWQQCCADDPSANVIDYELRTVDDRRIGVVSDVLFDDEAGVARYLVVDTSRAEFLVNQPRVLLPISLCCRDDAQRTVRSQAGVQEVQSAPGYERATAVTRAYEETVFTNFGERPYWPI